MDINVIIENIAELLTNSVNITDKFYDIFFNPEPMDVTFEQYNNENKLVEVTIPNRAKDLKNIRVGSRAPEGQVSAEVGTLYINSSVPQLYIKVEGTNESGWVAIPNQEETISIVRNYLEVNGYATEEYVNNSIGNGTIIFTQGGVQKGTITMNQDGDATIEFEAPSESGGVVVDQTYNPTSTNPQSGYAVAEGIGSISGNQIISALGYTPYDSSNPDNYISSIPTASTSTIGGIKYDNASLILNENEQLKANGVIEQRASVNTKFWVGTEAQYNSITTKDSNTVYITTDGTDASWADVPSRNIGEIVSSTIPLTDAGLHLLDGALLQYGSYQAFIDYIADLYDSGDYDDIFETEANWQTSVTTYGVCGKFVYEPSSNTVRLPKITGFVEGTTDVTALGDLVEAGLPNITAWMKGYLNTTLDASGAFQFYNSGYGHDGSWRQSLQSGGGDYSGVTLNASRSSSIYGNSTTVQPQTIKVLYYIVVATSTKTDIQVDIDEVVTDLNGKADTDLSNISASQSAKNTIVGWMMPDWSRAVSKVVGTTYTADQRGWVHANGATVQNGIHVEINGLTVAYCEAQGANDTSGFGCLVPVDIGDTYALFQNGGTVWAFNFIPCKGEV